MDTNKKNKLALLNSIQGLYNYVDEHFDTIGRDKVDKVRHEVNTAWNTATGNRRKQLRRLDDGAYTEGR